MSDWKIPPSLAGVVQEATRAWEDSRGTPAPEWVAKKAALDACDDGHGLWSRAEGEPTYQEEFLAWAMEHMGQGFSLAICDGEFVDIVTSYCHRGYVIGRRDEARQKFEAL